MKVENVKVLNVKVENVKVNNVKLKVKPCLSGESSALRVASRAEDTFLASTETSKTIPQSNQA